MSKRIFTATIAVIAVSLAGVFFGGVSSTASALSGSSFDAGRIIDDVVFYNNGSMSSSQIQSFLNSKVPACDTNGTQSAADWGYPSITHAQLAQYKREGSHGFKKDTGFHAPPYTCLKDYKQSTPQMEAASGLCGGLTAKTNRTAAQIIKDVSDVCGINPQVLIVLLNKEQSLVTDTWPLKRQYTNATGFACPDTAPCDPSYAGFFYQVFNAARQFKVYKSYPNSYNYVAGETNRIYWQTNLGSWVNSTGNYNSSRSSCGYSNVYIQNQATAALYIYTPYRPNQKALANLYGTGDSCSAYGNRNFWRMFSDWFGSTLRPGYAEIQARYDALDSSTRSSLGSSTSGVICGTKNDGCYKKYENGAISWNRATGAWETFGAIRERWAALSFENGALGYPKSSVNCGLIRSGCWQRYEYGFIVHTPTTGAWESKGGIRNYWVSTGSETGSLGYPIGAEIAANGGWYQNYENGYVVGSLNTGFWTSNGNIRTRWKELGTETGSLGYPLSDTACGLVDGGCWQRYQRGFIVKSSSGTWESKGGIRKQWVTLGAESGELGYPAGPETAIENGWFQKYTNGYIVGSNASGFWESNGDIRTRWKQLGSEGGSLGYPLSGVECTLINSGCYQKFQNGYILWSSTTGAWESSYGQIRNYWVTKGGEGGSLGYPTGATTTVNQTTKYQSFEHGKVYFKTPNTVWQSP